MELDIPGALKQMLGRAKDCENKGNAQKAADAYVRAAKLMRGYANQAVSHDAEERRRGKARDYEERARLLREGRVKLPEEKALERGGSNFRTGFKLTEQYHTMISPLKQKANVRWGDIGGLEETKREIKFTYGLALAKKPEAVLIRGFKNILFYGPPGTGKTLLAAATSNSLNATFFNVKASNLLSKWFGESPKLISALYDAARSEADEGGFAVIFIDEFDALSLQRGAGSDAGPERRVLSTLLAELDGLKEKGEDRFVLTIAATNAPWDLDAAALSRFQKRIYIPIPDGESRRQILKVLLEKRGHEIHYSYDELVARTEGFSGRDLERLCSEAINLMVAECNPDIPQRVDSGSESIKNYCLKVALLNRSHFDGAFKRVRVDQKGLAELERRFSTFYESY